MSYQDRFKKLILRMMQDKKRYNDINIRTKTPDERRIWDICEKFHGSDNWPSATEITNVKDDMDPVVANRYLNELEEILDRLDWGK